MPLTKYGIEAMGFTEIPSGTKIEAKFHSALVYSIEGINFKEFGPESIADLTHLGDDFSFAFGNSVNEISKSLLGDDFVKDESAWQKETKANPPYFIIHLWIKEPFYCTSGHWKEVDGQILTYDCFVKAKEDLRIAENKIIPPLISSLTVQLSKLHRPLRFKFTNKSVYAFTAEGKTLMDIRVEFSARGFTSMGVSPKDLKGKISDSLKQYSDFNPRVGSLFFSGLKEEDRFKQFLNLFQALEIHTHKTFAKIDFKKQVDKISPPIGRLEKTSRQFFIERQEESKNLAQRFMWCAIIAWESLEDADIEKFKQIKKCRDALSHGEEIPESTFPVDDLEQLLLKIL